MLMKFLIIVLTICIFPQIIFSQNIEQKIALTERVTAAPDSVFAMFRNAGMNPVDHRLTTAELSIVRDAFDKLPVGILTVLKKHLENISFMDSMPNTALTSPLLPDSGVKKFNITFRAGILKET
ncbi:MAG: hypothetical protein ABW174_07305, partial [Flavitalea sp.]